MASSHHFLLRALRSTCLISLFSTTTAIALSEGWLQISEPNAVPGYYYDPLSIKKVKEGFVSVETMINYISDEGNKESLLGVTLYDCVRRLKQEQSTVQYSQYWADGDVKIRLGLEIEWGTVKVGTDGMRLLRIVCS